MQDCVGKEVQEGFVVEISGAWSKPDNGFWLVERVYSDGECYLYRLNSDMSKSTRKLGAKTSWPLKCWSNNIRKKLEIDRHNQENAKIRVLAPWVEPQKKEKSNELRILKNGIRKGENYCPCLFYKRNNGEIVVSSRHYNTHIPRELGNVENNSDSMTDYFETDSCVVTPDNPYYSIIMKKVFGD